MGQLKVALLDVHPPSAYDGFKLEALKELQHNIDNLHPTECFMGQTFDCRGAKKYEEVEQTRAQKLWPWFWLETVEILYKCIPQAPPKVFVVEMFFFFQQIALKKTYPAEQRQLRSFELGKDGCCSDKTQQGACGQLKMGSTVNDIQHHRTFFAISEFPCL